MLAFELFEGTREAYSSQWHEDHPKKNGKAGDAEFRAMQRQKQLQKRGYL